MNFKLGTFWLFIEAFFSLFVPSHFWPIGVSLLCLLSSVFLSSFQSHNHSLSMFAASVSEAPSGVTGIVEDEGYCSLHLDFGMTVSVAPNGVRL